MSGINEHHEKPTDKQSRLTEISYRLDLSMNLIRAVLCYVYELNRGPQSVPETFRPVS